MKLRKPCEHGRYDEHFYLAKTPYADLPDSVCCPGGVFLPDDALVIEKVEGRWPESAREMLRTMLWSGKGFTLDMILDALSVREAE